MFGIAADALDGPLCNVQVWDAPPAALAFASYLPTASLQSLCVHLCRVAHRILQCLFVASMELVFPRPHLVEPSKTNCENRSKPMSILTVLTLIRPVFYRLLDKNRSRLPWFALLFLCAIGFSAVEWSQPSFAQTATIPDAGRIRIFKVTEPRGDTTEFSFQLTSQDRNRSFSLADGGKRAFANLAPGDGYAVSEMVPTGWTSSGGTGRCCPMAA